MADEQAEKDFAALQAKMLENNGKMKAAISSLRTKEGDKKRAELTEQELLVLPDETVVYKALGRAFVMAPKTQVQEEMKATSMRLAEEIEKAAASKEYLKRAQTDIENNMKELIEGSSYLKAKLMSK